MQKKRTNQLLVIRSTMPLSCMGYPGAFLDPCDRTGPKFEGFLKSEVYLMYSNIGDFNLSICSSIYSKMRLKLHPEVAHRIPDC